MKQILQLFIFFLFGIHCTSNAQNNYRQQRVDYIIKVKLDDEKHTLSGHEKMTYFNNSTQTMHELYIHLWPNAYKNLNTPLAKQLLEAGETRMYWSKPEERGFIDSLSFKINGTSVNYQLLKDTIDICKITLPTPLKPGESIEIETPFFVKIPSAMFSRLGHIEQQYQITQWYPKPAVYENGTWKYIPYLNQGEFYSEYASYNVYITLPKNYVVGATGDLRDGEKELEWLNAKVEETKNTTSFSKDMSFPSSDKELKTVHYYQENVHDFAWFADKRYHVLKGEVELPHSKRKITTWTMFTNSQANTWLKSIDYINDAIHYYSLWNGDYPYEQCTAVDGTISAGGGMEYPNITVIGETSDPFMLDLVIAHEVGHNWFYGILGSNERENGWMDEGINSFNEMRYIQTKYPNRKLVGDLANGPIGKWFDIKQYHQSSQYYLGYYISKIYNVAQPIQTHSALFSEMNYGTIVYMKTALIFNYLKNYLGEEVFDKGMQAYFNEWKFKHPKPTDLQAVLEKNSEKNLSWFFNDLIKTDKEVDYKIVNGGNNDKGTFVKIKNKGQIESPVMVSGIIDGKQRASVWYNGFKGTQWLSFPPGNYDSFIIDYPQVMPEINRRNNTLNNKKLFKKIEPLRLQFLGSLDNPKKTQLFYSPVMGWNKNNGFMAGLAIYNHVLPSKKIEYTLVPMYGFKNKKPAGFADAYYVIKPEKVFTTVRIGGDVKSYSYFNNTSKTFPFDYNYLRIAPTLQFDLKNKNYRSSISQNIKLRTLLMQEDISTLNRDSKNSVIGINPKKWNSTILDAVYILNNSRRINPFNLTVQHAQSNRFARTSATFKYTFTYPKQKEGVEIRLFAGKMWYADNYSFSYMQPYSNCYGLSMDGNNDFTYDQILLDRYRQGNYFNRQFFISDGGFKNLTNQSMDYNWLTACNIFAPIPKFFLAGYADMGLSASSNGLIVNTGIAIVPIKNIWYVYIPLYQNYQLNQLKFAEKIRFTLQLNNLNPFEAIRNIKRFI